MPSRVAKLLVKRFGDAEAVLDAAAEHVAEGGDGGATSNATPPKWLRALPDVHASRDKVRKKLRLAVLRDGPEATLESALVLMRDHGFSGLPVVAGSKPVGIITTESLAGLGDLDL